LRGKRESGGRQTLLVLLQDGVPYLIREAAGSQLHIPVGKLQGGERAGRVLCTNRIAGRGGDQRLEDLVFSLFRLNNKRILGQAIEDVIGDDHQRSGAAGQRVWTVVAANRRTALTSLIYRKFQDAVGHEL